MLKDKIKRAFDKYIIEEIKKLIDEEAIDNLAELTEKEIKYESEAWRYIAKWNGKMLIEAYREIGKLKRKINEK